MSDSHLEACLPPTLRNVGATFSRMAEGWSGAGVFRVEAAGQAFVLKVSDEREPVASWRRKLRMRELAAEAGLAPAVIHVDEARRAVVGVYVVDRSFFALYGNPATRGAALTQLGRTLRRVHDLPLPPDADGQDPRDFLAQTWWRLGESATVPAFVVEAVQRVLAFEVPAPERAVVLSHNDVNPTNLVYDGEHLLLLDWDVAGRNTPFYDLAAIAVFLRMDDETCQRLLAAHDDTAVAVLPAAFVYHRRLVAALCGAMFLQLARNSGHAGAAGETLQSAPSLEELYGRMRSGAVSAATADGQWAFGLALVKTSTML
jgi:aminoglycoside phosphotransferase (APT) family kinase protein